jgi:aminoglycoside 3-N-acetyltransferase I
MSGAPNNIRVRRVTPEDAGTLALDLDTLRVRPAACLEAFLANPRNYLLVAYDANVPTGYLIGYELQRPDSHRPRSFIYDLDVAQGHRRRGAGTALVETFKVACREHSGREVFVQTLGSDARAVAFYLGTGAKLETPGTHIYVWEFGKR